MTDGQKIWRNMTPEEKGALLLAEHEGKVIEFIGGGVEDWSKAEPKWADWCAYRVRPDRETVTLYGSEDKAFGKCIQHNDTHRITFDTVDGKPDCASIRMERIK